MNDLLARADAVIAGKSRSYVDDARDLAKAYRDLVTHHASYCISPETYLALEARLRAATSMLTKCAGIEGPLQQEVMLALVACHEEADPPPVANYKQALANLDAAQAAGSRLMIENQALHGENKRLKEALIKLASSGEAVVSRVCGFEKSRGEFCNLPAPRFVYQYANGKSIDLCAQHAREMRGSRERE